MDDGLLSQCNETELITIAQTQGIGRLRRGIPRDVLLAVVAGYQLSTPDQLSGTSLTRQRLEATLAANIERARSQLPGCDGRCTTFNCSDGRHSVCYLPNEDTIHS